MIKLLKIFYYHRLYNKISSGGYKRDLDSEGMKGTTEIIIREQLRIIQEFFQNIIRDG